MIKSISNTIFMIALVLASTVLYAQQPQYQIHDMSPVLGQYIGLWEINNSGVIMVENFTWSASGGRVDLLPADGDARCLALRINNAGTTAGSSATEMYSEFGDKYYLGHAVTWDSNGNPRSLRTLPGEWRSSASAINDLGQVAGTVTTEDQPGSRTTHVVLWDTDGNPSDLFEVAAPDGISVMDINNSGLIVCNGNGSLAGSWIYNGTDLVELDNLGFRYSVSARDVNDAGLIAGDTFSSEGYDYERATVWNPDGTIKSRLDPFAGAFGSEGSAINNNGEVIGHSYIEESGQIIAQRATYWSSDGIAVDLGTLPGDTNSYACGINDSGWIVGWSGVRPVIWTPVPEPAGITALICGIGAAVLKRRKI